MNSMRFEGGAYPGGIGGGACAKVVVCASGIANYRSHTPEGY